MKTKLKKIHIVGNSGSGKSRLANIISDKLNVPHIDLDDVLYQPDYSDRLTGELLKPHLEKIIARPKWVVEGIYLEEVLPLFKNADMIIWLDISMSIALWRITKRHFQDTLRGREKRGFRNFIKFFRSVYKGYKIDPNNDYFYKTLKPHQSKLIHISNQKELEQFLFSMKFN